LFVNEITFVVYYKYVKVKGSFKNREGEVVQTGDTYAVGSEGLSPGESTNFLLYASTRNHEATSCSVTIYDCD